VFTAISAQPGIVTKQFSIVTDEEIHHNLYLQFQALWVKEVMQGRGDIKWGARDDSSDDLHTPTVR